MEEYDNTLSFSLLIPPEFQTETQPVITPYCSYAIRSYCCVKTIKVLKKNRGIYLLRLEQYYYDE